MVDRMILSAKNNRITKEEQEKLQHTKFDPVELLKLKRLDRKELLYLMMFCDIRLLNEVPVAALTDDELRLAYTLWRAEGQKVRIAKKHKRHYTRRRVTNWAKEYIKRGLKS